MQNKQPFQPDPTKITTGNGKHMLVNVIEYVDVNIVIMQTGDSVKKNEIKSDKKKKKTVRYFEESQNQTAQVFKINTRKLKYKKLNNVKRLERGKHISNKRTGGKNKDWKKNVNDSKGFRNSQSWKGSGRKKQKSQHVDVKNFRVKQDPFEGKAPVPDEVKKKYSRGKPMNTKTAREHKALPKFKQTEDKIQMAVTEAARAEMLLQEEPGFLVAEEGEATTDISQHEIADAVDIASAQKHFELKLTDFGPYHVKYTRNGRFLLMGGAKGHVAAIDWMTKKLMCEMNVMETVYDVEWLHQETMFAVAQKQWTYIYDNQGVELHCLKMLDRVLRMEFLPFHFLLATSSAKGYLSWIDVTVGQRAGGWSTGFGRLDVMCQNPQNAVLCLGHAGGTVTMWTPNLKGPAVKMLCHQSGIRSVAIDSQGRYLATSAIDRTLKIWDLRTYKMMQSYKIGIGAQSMSFSQRGLLAVGKGNIVEVYQDCCERTVTSPYLTHGLPSAAVGIQFCPYEDVLGVGHGLGFESLIVPGAGEPNFDALEANPYQTKKQRQEAEVKMLLDKIPADMIHLNVDQIGKIDVKTAQEKMNEQNKLKYMTRISIDHTGKLKNKSKGRNSGAKKVQRKKGVIEEKKRDVLKGVMKERQRDGKKNKKGKKKVNKPAGTNVLDRFKKTKQS